MLTSVANKRVGTSRTKRLLRTTDECAQDDGWENERDKTKHNDIRRQRQYRMQSNLSEDEEENAITRTNDDRLRITTRPYSKLNPGPPQKRWTENSDRFLVNPFNT